MGWEEYIKRSQNTDLPASNLCSLAPAPKLLNSFKGKKLREGGHWISIFVDCPYVFKTLRKVQNMALGPTTTFIIQPLGLLYLRLLSPSFSMLHSPSSWLPLSWPHSIPRKSHPCPLIHSEDSLPLRIHLLSLSWALDSYFQLLLQLFQILFHEHLQLNSAQILDLAFLQDPLLPIPSPLMTSASA